MDEFDELCKKAGYKKYSNQSKNKKELIPSQTPIHQAILIYKSNEGNNSINKDLFHGFVSQKKITNYIELNDTKRLDKNTTKYITKEKISFDGTIDLHGLKIPEAFDIFMDFIRKNFLLNKRFLLVITGLGKEDNPNTIRNNLITWLTDNHELQKVILYFGYAQNKNGGEGAFCIHLSRFTR